ncbi:MAG: hypothetical protein A2508_09590 [Candidatus Lambdaproteobacteria bacterium RIFOXYD12_FULL_49_8]|uniref:Methyltransferase n=1 Tax=Candidatus Lambdaproteobacteria bacterium RIFOXYD2_FULL_50_16 TaxID=1817772 RepID=A0A1F6GF80_9PROT|nr:MAG: hypothetical protein A2527_04090 [Candidatus Lambdaproteobacteria bacterium RIFOXYD2_FULL_50_16]OGG97995.1 MAG: hypothetical protein A2508_09590 [Candidatus Lambdaproteobacteria bacterium RIFOXYD12_FULL_49_8]
MELLAVEAYFSGLEGALPDSLKRVKDYALEHQVPVVSDQVGGFLKLLCGLTKPKRILELGSGISYSTHWMLLGWPNAQIVSVDANGDRIELARGFLEASGALTQVELHSSWIEPFLETRLGEFDLIFLDSVKKDYATLLSQCYKILLPEGLLVADNILYQGKVLSLLPEQEKKYAAGVGSIKAFNQAVAEHPALDAHFLSIGDGLLVARKLA